MANIIIFGTNDLAELAYFYLANDSSHTVCGFSANKEFINKSKFKGLPVIPFEDIENKFKTDKYMFFVPMIGSKMNKNRERIYKQAKEKGYKFISYISSKATTFKNEIGENCFILEDNTIQPFVKIGNNVVLWSGNHIGHHSVIKDNVFITSHVVISGNCTIEQNCFIGVNSTLKEKITLGEGTYVAMNTGISRNTEPFSVYKSASGEIVNMSSLRIRF